jgi:hypothetical protein
LTKFSAANAAGKPPYPFLRRLASARPAAGTLFYENIHIFLDIMYSGAAQVPERDE